MIGDGPARLPGLGRVGLLLAVAALSALACSGGGTSAPTADPPAALEPAQPPATPESPVESPAESDGEPATEDTTDGEAGANDTAPAGTAEEDSLAGQEPAETEPFAGLSAELEADLRALLEELAGIAGAWIPAGRAAVAVVTPDGELYGLNEHRQHVSASAVKPIWAAAAIDLAGLDAVMPLSEGALVRSDNYAAGEIIDLVGIDSVNDWSRDVAGATGTHLAAWYFGTDRVAQSVIAGGTRANLTTVADLALFYARLRQGELLDPDGVDALEGWLRATPRGSAAPGAVNGALLARLPEDVAAPAVHKTGWLPPYCCRAEVRLIIDAGTIPLPGESWFAIAAVSDRGAAYNLSVDWVALAACRIYVLLAGDTSHSCERPDDGTPRPDLWRPPPELDPAPDDAEEPPAPDEAEEPPAPDDAEEPPAPDDAEEPRPEDDA